MRVLLLLCLLAPLSVFAQEPEAKTSFHLEGEVFATRSTMLETADDFQNRFDFGAAFGVLARRSFSPRFSLEAGVGGQYTQLRQRSKPFRFGCDRGETTTYLDSEVDLFSLTVPLAAIFHLNGTPDGVYLKPGVNVNLNFSPNTYGDLHECGLEDGSDFTTEDVTVERFTFHPSLAVGYQFADDDGRVKSLEFGIAASTGELIHAEGENFAGDFVKSAGVLVASINMVWQIGGKKKDRRPKKQQPAPVPGFSTF